jgi:hypothetical protein
MVTQKLTTMAGSTSPSESSTSLGKTRSRDLNSILSVEESRAEQSFARTRKPGTGRVVPQTSREQLNAAVSTSDDYMPDAPAEERPLFSEHLSE